MLRGKLPTGGNNQPRIISTPFHPRRPPNHNVILERHSQYVGRHFGADTPRSCRRNGRRKRGLRLQPRFPGTRRKDPSSAKILDTHLYNQSICTLLMSCRRMPFVRICKPPSQIKRRNPEKGRQGSVEITASVYQPDNAFVSSISIRATGS